MTPSCRAASAGPISHARSHVSRQMRGSWSRMVASMAGHFLDSRSGIRPLPCRYLVYRVHFVSFVVDFFATKGEQLPPIREGRRAPSTLFDHHHQGVSRNVHGILGVQAMFPGKCVHLAVDLLKEGHDDRVVFVVDGWSAVKCHRVGTTPFST